MNAKKTPNNYNKKPPNSPKPPKSPKPPMSPNTPRSPKDRNARNKALAESAYGNVFPVAVGGSSYNTATKMTKMNKGNALYSGTMNPQVKRIIAVIEPRGYKLIKEIGSGNYATVYSAVDRKEKIIALKVINLKKASNNYKLKFLPRELKVMSRVRHPNIVSIYEILQSSNNIYILMEFAPNGTVGDLLRKNGALSERRCKPMFKCVLEAIHYMHSCGISHRDIKIENIILDHKMSPKITDFSYSKAEDLKEGKTRDLSRTFCGSLPYLSPEVLQQKSYDPLVSDIWGLGIALYIMLCDALPFTFKNLNTMLENQLTRKWKLHPRVDSVLSDTVKDILPLMLEPDVQKRKTTTTLLLHPWVK